MTGNKGRVAKLLRRKPFDAVESNLVLVDALFQNLGWTRGEVNGGINSKKEKEGRRKN